MFTIDFGPPRCEPNQKDGKLFYRLQLCDTQSRIWQICRLRGSEIATEPESLHIQAVKQVVVKKKIIIIFDLLNSMMLAKDFFADFLGFYVAQTVSEKDM